MSSRGPKTRKLFRKYGWSPREVIAALEASVLRFIARTRGGGAQQCNYGKEGKEPFAVFVLKKSIKIPVHPFMFFAWMK